MIHVDTAGQKVLGRRLAGLVGIDHFGDRPAYRGLRRGPRIESVTFDGGGRRRVRLRYSGVNGRLVSEGRVSGFSVSGPGEEVLPQPFKVRIDPAEPDSVLIFFPRPLPPGAELWYGRGYDPYCNLIDEAGMAALAAGPLEIGAGEEK